MSKPLASQRSRSVTSNPPNVDSYRGHCNTIMRHKPDSNNDGSGYVFFQKNNNDSFSTNFLLTFRHVSIRRDDRLRVMYFDCYFLIFMRSRDTRSALYSRTRLIWQIVYKTLTTATYYHRKRSKLFSFRPATATVKRVQVAHIEKNAIIASSEYFSYNVFEDSTPCPRC